MDEFLIEHARSESPAPARGREIGREAEDRLKRAGYLALSDVSCDACDGVVSLRGRLPSYYLKQIAQAVAAQVEGVRHIVNRIEVIAPARLAVVGCDRVATQRSDSL